MIYLSYNIPPPANVTNMFGRWLNGVSKNDKQKIRIGVSAICWAVWRTRDLVFNNQSGTNFLQVIRRAAHSIQQWVFLLPVEQREDMVIGCNRMLVVAQDFFFQATGWRHNNRITNA
jgi:two-component response regulator (ARR-B family)